MGTVIRADISKKSKYYIDKHRYYELKHFCMQYESWKGKLENLSYYISNPSMLTPVQDSHSDPIEKLIEARDVYETRIDIVETSAECTDHLLAPYILEAVSKGLSYEKLNAVKQIPCNRETWYELYRRFFWILNDIRS